MKVAFWNVTGAPGNATGYFSAIGAYCAICLKKEVFLSSNHLRGRRLEDYFFNDSTKSGKEKYTDSYLYGEAGYFRKLWEENPGRQERAITLQGIHLLAPPDLMAPFMFYHEIPEKTLYFMDLSEEMNAFSFRALEEADLVVVILPQDKTEIHNFFDHYSSIIPKALFFIAEYRKEIRDTPKDLQNLYGVEEEQICVLPYFSEFDYVCEMGAVEELFHIERTGQTKQEAAFVEAIGEIAERITRRAEEICKIS